MEKAHYPIKVLCRTLKVSRSGYYAWSTRPESQHAQEDRRLSVHIRAAFETGRRYYGSPRVLRELRAQGIVAGKKRVARLMRVLGLKASARLFLAIVLDLFSRFVVGWAVSPTNDRHLVMRALEMGIKRRCPDAGLLHHSDQGSPYTSEDYRKALEERGITCSMSRRGNCYDNAVMESWFSTLKAELGERFESFGEAKDELFDYIEIFYNQQRRHSTLDYVSPAEYERKRLHLAA